MLTCKGKTDIGSRGAVQLVHLRLVLGSARSWGGEVVPTQNREKNVIFGFVVASGVPFDIFPGLMVWYNLKILNGHAGPSRWWNMEEKRWIPFNIGRHHDYAICLIACIICTWIYFFCIWNSFFFSEAGSLMSEGATRHPFLILSLC